MSTVRLQPEVRLAEQSHEEIAAGLLEMVFEERGLNELRDRLTDIAAVLSPHELAAVYEIARSMTTDEGGAHLPRLAPMWMQLRKGGGEGLFARGSV